MIHCLQKYLPLLYLLISTSVCAHHITINNARIHEGPPAQTILGGYMSINNQGADDEQIQSISSELFERIEIHKTIIQNGLAKMEMQKELTINKNAVLQLKPGGQHLMLINPLRRIKAGDSIILQFTLQDGSEFEAVFPVIKANSAEHHHSHH